MSEVKRTVESAIARVAPGDQLDGFVTSLTVNRKFLARIPAIEAARIPDAGDWRVLGLSPEEAIELGTLLVNAGRQSSAWRMEYTADGVL